MKKLSRDHVTEGDEEKEDAYKQLKEDLKSNDLLEDDDEDEITEEDMALLERKLENALGNFDAKLLNSDDLTQNTKKKKKKGRERIEDDDEKYGPKEMEEPLLSSSSE
ncbi:hypothetical protein E2542_SST31466 [Spatholobus suberectus]|nr:hypothetical protein E2542_SST31466 [Spatholobus suberectus]